MRTVTDSKTPIRVSALRLVVVGLVVLGMASCRVAVQQPTVRTEPNLDPGWPRPNPFFTEACYPQVRAELPTIQGSNYLKDDESCEDCHPTYTRTFAENVHCADGCESCHGPASQHVNVGEGSILSFIKKPQNPAALAEICLKCHEQNQCTEGARWRTSKHANCGVTCVSCHRAHYNVPPGKPATVKSRNATLQQLQPRVKQAAYRRKSVV